MQLEFPVSCLLGPKAGFKPCLPYLAHWSAVVYYGKPSSHVISVKGIFLFKFCMVFLGACQTNILILISSWHFVCALQRIKLV